MNDNISSPDFSGAILIFITSLIFKGQLKSPLLQEDFAEYPCFALTPVAFSAVSYNISLFVISMMGSLFV